MNNNHNAPLPSSVTPLSYQTPTLTTTIQNAEILNNLNNTNNQFNSTTNTSQSSPLTSTGITTNNSENVNLENNLGEALDCATIKIA